MPKVKTKKYIPEEGDVITFVYNSEPQTGTVVDICTNHVVVYPHSIEPKDSRGEYIDMDWVVPNEDIVGKEEG